MADKDITAQHRKAKECNLGNFRILIVDDFPFMAELLSGILKEIGIGKAITCENAHQAQKHIEHTAKNHSASTHIDLALIDWLMPEMNGVDLVRWIRSQEQDHIRFMPIILISAYTSMDVVEASRDNGANEALVKPVSTETLVSRIVHIINHQRPFIRNDNFFGPDRRRKEEPYKGEEKRKMNPESLKVHRENV